MERFTDVCYRVGIPSHVLAEINSNTVVRLVPSAVCGWKHLVKRMVYSPVRSAHAAPRNRAPARHLAVQKHEVERAHRCPVEMAEDAMLAMMRQE